MNHDTWVKRIKIVPFIDFLVKVSLVYLWPKNNPDITWTDPNPKIENKPSLDQLDVGYAQQKLGPDLQT